MEMVNEIVMKPIGEIKPYEKNPRKNDKTVDLLVDIIPKVGFNVPLVIDENGVIVKGHARYLAAKKLGMKELPCVVSHADPEAIKADRITDNKISEFSEWLTADVLEEIKNINFDFDFSELGFPTVSFEGTPKVDKAEGLAQEVKPKESPVEVTPFSEPKKEVQPVKYFKVVCEKCGKVMFVRAK